MVLMANRISAIAHPPVLINRYLSEKIREYLPDRFNSDQDGPWFFPTSPTDINSLTEQFPEATENVFAVYDRMFRLRRTPFPHIKQEQILYYFYKMAGDPVDLIETIQVVYDLLDRGDESAQDVNSWITYKFENEGEEVEIKKSLPNKRPYYIGGLKETDEEASSVFGDFVDLEEYDVVDIYNSILINGKPFLMPYFHEFKIFQLEEARDIISFGTARTYAGNKLIINYDWHAPSPIRTTIRPKV
jgi:hypothetical protein